MLAEHVTKEMPMQAYRVETQVQQDGQLTLQNLPLQAGEEVEVMILVRAPKGVPQTPYPLRGLPVTYHQPTEPVATQWGATR
jgi:hypothetical protein